jgi:hypothetical protein
MLSKRAVFTLTGIIFQFFGDHVKGVGKFWGLPLFIMGLVSGRCEKQSEKQA